MKHLHRLIAQPGVPSSRVPHRWGRIAMAASAATLTSLSTLAQTPAASSPDDTTRYGIGAAVLSANEGYRGGKSETTLIPGLSIENKWVRLFGPQLDLKLAGNDARTWWIGPRIEYRFDGYEAADSAFLSGMAKRKGGVFAGIAGEFDLGNRFSLDFDVLRGGSEGGNERGRVASLGVSRAYPSGAWTVVPRIGIETASSSYVNYYYGVRASEATAARAAYSGKSTTNLEFGVLVNYTLDRNQKLFANFNVERYGSGIKDSPIMDKSGQAQVVFGYQYDF